MDENEFLSSVTSWHGLKTINETEKIIPELCAQNHIFILTSSFHHHPGRLYMYMTISEWLHKKPNKTASLSKPYGNIPSKTLKFAQE